MKPKFRPSLAETRRINQQALDYYQALSAKPDAPRIDVGAKAKRAPKPFTLTAPETGEDEVVRGITQLLARHPLVHIAARHNNGSVVADETPTSARRYVWFNKLIKGRGIIVDFTGVLKTGIPWAIEAKASDWKMPVPDSKSSAALRARQQALYLQHVRDCGGRAGFATSVDEALRIIEGRS